jgi:hypothetical protein
MPPVDHMMREAKIKALADVIEDASVRKRVKTEMGIGLIRARGGHEPLAKISGCDGCKRPGHGTHQFLCLEKMKFKTSVEKKVFEKVRQPTATASARASSTRHCAGARSRNRARIAALATVQSSAWR